jgi:hypothetical protein
VKIASAAAVLLTISGPPAAAQQLRPRWQLEIRGPDIGEWGELRFAGTTGQVALQHDDTAFELMHDLRVAGGRISFSAVHAKRRFEGTITDSVLSGTVRDGAGHTSTWTAVPIDSGRELWPVAPRVIVRQLALGSSATIDRVPAAWLAAAPDTTLLEREYRTLASQAGLTPLRGADRASRADMVVLGLDDSARAAMRAVLTRISQGAAADAEFRGIFLRDGRWKIDIHDEVVWEAPHYLYGFDMARAGRGLQSLHELAANTTDLAAIRQSGWRLWSAAGTSDSTRIRAAIDTLVRRGDSTVDAVRALLAGFDDSTAWWQRALHWLLTHPWLDTPDGRRSPAQLMATFWGVDSLPLPAIIATRFGAAAAMPSLSIDHVARFLFRPGNATAPDWLAHGGSRDAFATWRALRWGEIPLTVVTNGQSETVASPVSQALVHPASFFGLRDAIRIDPGIAPLAAVVTYLHEWNHLIAEERRLAGAHPPAVIAGPVQLQLREENPWLSEGFAEWATDQVLRPAGASASFLRFTQAEKRLGIAAGAPNDPHALGATLVRAAATRLPRRGVLRELMVSHLDDLDAVAKAIGLASARSGADLMLARPATAVVIPEVTFTWDEGAASGLSRRLVLSQPRSEP